MTAISYTAAADGTPIGLRRHARRGSVPGSAVIYAHGGRMMTGSLDASDTLLSL